MNRNDRFKRMALCAALASMTLLAAGCGGGDGEAVVAPAPPAPAPNAPASVERDISPVAADPQVDTATEVHVAINPSPAVAAANKLFVFLPGTEGTPDMYRLVLRSGAARGFHTLGLNYPNPIPVGVLCNNSPDVNCFWDVRREIITGADDTLLVDVNNANSIVTRLTKALQYLDTNHPGEGWGQYLNNGAINWSKVMVGGHSQGGGHAGVMAKLYPMNRAVYFSSPPDWSTNFDAAAEWTSKPNVTPASSQYAFAHVQDGLVDYGHMTVIWQAMGLTAFGAPVSVDGNTAPFGSSHLLSTQATPNNAGLAVSPTHGAPVLDAVTPMNGSTPLFDPVWAYLAFQ